MNPKRWLHEHSLKLLAIRDTPEAIAGGVAIGIFIGFTPLIGLKTVLTILFAWLARSNIIAAVLASAGHDILWPVLPVIFPLGVPGGVLAAEPSSSLAAAADQGELASACLARLDQLPYDRQTVITRLGRVLRADRPPHLPVHAPGCGAASAQEALAETTWARGSELSRVRRISANRGRRP